MSAAAGVKVTANIVLTRRLGAGGMGTVWLAEHLTLRKNVVVKLMNEHVVTDETFRLRFAQEAAAGANVKSPHVVHVLDAGVSDELGPYIVMESLEGEDLAVRLARDRILPVADVVRLVAQAAHALDRAHASGIVHRDIKPGNLFLCVEPGAPFFLKVLDFGVARWRSETPLTGVGIAVGTPTYMSPEQATAQEIDGRSDLYSLALVAFRALTGAFAITRASIDALGLGVYNFPLPKPTERRADLPLAFDAWFARAASREPSARYPDGATLAAELARALDVEAVPTRLDAASDDVATALDATAADVAPRSSDPTEARRTPDAAARESPTTHAAIEAPGAPLATPDPGAPPARAVASRKSSPLGAAALLVVAVAGAGAWRMRAFYTQESMAPSSAPSVAPAPSASASASPAPIPVGVLLDLSGERRQAGQALLDATRAAVKTVNDSGGVRGRPLELVVSDDRGDDAAWLEGQARALVTTAGLKVILGPMRSEQVVVVAPIAQAAGVLELTGSATSPSLSTLQRPDQRLLFRTVPSQTRIADALARVMRGEGVAPVGSSRDDAASERARAPSVSCKRAAILASDDVFGRPFVTAFIPAFKAHGGKSIEAIFVPPAAQLSYAKELSDLARARVDCQVLAVSPKSAARYLRQAQSTGAREADPRTLPTFAVAHLASEDFVEYARAVPRDPSSASVAEGVRGVRPAIRIAARPESQELTFLLGAIDAGAESRDAPFVPSQFDAAILAALTLDRAGPDADANALRQGLFSVARGDQIFGPHEVPQLLAAIRRGESVNYVGASGDLMFDANGDVDAELEAWVVRDGKVRDDGRVAPATAP